jgi:predicted NAD-dependent protein-ADP-ribosyltransferase YbiA (DUF1768 family)
MYSKAKLFQDNETAAKILQEDAPSVMKALGRRVKNYDDTKWCTLREDISTKLCA